MESIHARTHAQARSVTRCVFTLHAAWICSSVLTETGAPGRCTLPAPGLTQSASQAAGQDTALPQEQGRARTGSRSHCRPAGAASSLPLPEQSRVWRKTTSR